ncbi:MAG: hypothetical protein C5617_001405 [ANME-2 cluster archaeon]|jgi:hypothetical protein|nr:MAG: hypothetical protein C5617_001405 [ANME-2 cluster archaeon]
MIDMTCMTTINKNGETTHTHTHDSDIYTRIIPGLGDGTGHGTDHFAESITEEIVGIHHSIKDFVDREVYQDPSGHLKAVFQQLDYLIALDIDDRSAEDLLSNSRFNSAFDAITTFRSQYTAELEAEQVNSILKSRDPWNALTNFTYLPKIHGMRLRISHTSRITSSWREPSLGGQGLNRVTLFSFSEAVHYP